MTEIRPSVLPRPVRVIALAIALAYGGAVWLGLGLLDQHRSVPAAGAALSQGLRDGTLMLPPILVVVTIGLLLAGVLLRGTSATTALILGTRAALTGGGAALVLCLGVAMRDSLLPGAPDLFGGSEVGARADFGA